VVYNFANNSQIFLVQTRAESFICFVCFDCRYPHGKQGNTESFINQASTWKTREDSSNFKGKQFKFQRKTVQVQGKAISKKDSSSSAIRRPPGEQGKIVQVSRESSSSFKGRQFKFQQ